MAAAAKPDLLGLPAVYLDIAEVFSKQRALSLPPHWPYECTINLQPGAALPTSRLYQLAKPEWEALESYLQEYLAAGFISASSSPVGPGFFFVQKKDCSLRPCIDYQGLNVITIRNKYPLPMIDAAFTPLQRARIFTKLDLWHAYHLVCIREGDEWETAFKIPLGHFEYWVMPFGLTNVPAVFQALVNYVFRDLLSKCLFVYLDDILIFSETEEEHVQPVPRVLRRLMENGLFAKQEKCEFHKTSVSSLGYIIWQGHLVADPANVRAVTEWSVPGTRKDLQRFLGFANFYRRFIRDYSQLERLPARGQILDPTLLMELCRAHPEKPGRAPGVAPRGGGDVGGRSGTPTQPGHERAQTETGRRETPADSNQLSEEVHKHFSVGLFSETLK